MWETRLGSYTKTEDGRVRVVNWRPITSDGEDTASVQCPGCEQWATLDHVIAPDGRVAPSVVCETDGCGFHELITLVGWQRLALRSVPTGEGGQNG